MIIKMFFFLLAVVQVVGVTVIPIMVQKYQSPVRVYKHPFELVMAVSVSSYSSGRPSVHMDITAP